MFPLYADNDADIKAFIEANSDVEVLNVVNDPVNPWAVIGDSLYTKKSSTLSVTFTSDCITELGYSVGRELYIDDIRYKESGYYDDTYYDKCIYRSDADYNLSGYLITEALDYNFPIDYNNDGRLDFVTYISLNLTVLILHRNLFLPFNTILFGATTLRRMATRICSLLSATQLNWVAVI